MILYIKDSQIATRKLLELINEIGKVAGYKINMQKSVAFLYTDHRRSEREIPKTIPLTTASKKKRKLGQNLSKETKDLYSKNSKKLMKKFTDGKICHVHK